MPYSASLIAYAFVKKGIENGKPVTQMKVQKMVFFAHGYSLARFGEPLIEEEFEAWKFGPVIPTIYQTYKFYGSADITDVSLIVNVDLLESELCNLDANALDAINYTWKVTKNMPASSLSAWTHKAGSPWQEVYRDNINSIPIKNEKIGKYFTSILAS